MENGTVTSADRRAFLLWFGSNFEFKQPAALDILRFFLQADEHLARLRIIEDCSCARPLLVVAVRGSKHPGLLYQTNAGSTNDATSILMDLALMRGRIHLAPYFPRQTQCRLFNLAKEKEVRAAADLFAPAQTDAELDPLIMRRQARLMFLVDQALERRDEAAFAVLVAELKKVLKGRDYVRST